MGHQKLYSRTVWWFLTARFRFITIAMIVKVIFWIENNSRTLAQSNPDIPPSHQVFNIQHLYKYRTSHHLPILLNSQDSCLRNVITNGSFYKRIIQHHICQISHSHTFPASSKLLRPVGGKVWIAEQILCTPAIMQIHAITWSTTSLYQEVPIIRRSSAITVAGNAPLNLPRVDGRAWTDFRRLHEHQEHRDYAELLLAK